MADAPAPFTYAELIIATVAVREHADRLREMVKKGAPSAVFAAKRAATLDRIVTKLTAHATHLLATGDVEAQRAELYR